VILIEYLLLLVHYPIIHHIREGASEQVIGILMEGTILTRVRLVVVVVTSSSIIVVPLFRFRELAPPSFVVIVDDERDDDDAATGTTYQPNLTS
jgi:hypothetical protein